jgi:hypothetical protein
MELGRLAWAVPTDAVDAATGMNPALPLSQQLAECPVFQAELRIFVKATGDSPATLDQVTVAGEYVDVINPTTKSYRTSDLILIAELVEERWTVVPVDDTATLIKGYLVDCLKKCDVSGTVRIYKPNPPTAGNGGQSGCGAGRNGLIAQNMSGGGSMPPEIVFGAGASVDIAAVNAWAKYAITGSAVWIRIVRGHDPANYSIEIVDVEDTIAKKLDVQKTGGAWVYSAHWDGTDPRTCEEPTITAEFDDACFPEGTTSIALYKPEADEYTVLTPMLPLEQIWIPQGEMVASCDDNVMTYTQQEIQRTVIACEDDTGIRYVTKFSLTQALFACLDLCWWICTYCAHLFMFDPEECTPCTGECVWEYQSTGDFTLQSSTCEPDTDECGCLDQPVVGDADVPSGILPGGTITRECGQFVQEPPPEAACCEIIHTMSSVTINGGAGNTYGAEAHVVRWINNCKFELECYCFDSDGAEIGGDGIGFMEWYEDIEVLSGDCASNPEPDNGAWYIEVWWPDDEHVEAGWAGCGCCEADFTSEGQIDATHDLTCPLEEL